MTPAASFAPLLERFFTQRLMQQRQASPHTISSYRDTFRQFLKFVCWRARTFGCFSSLADRSNRCKTTLSRRLGCCPW